MKQFKYMKLGILLLFLNLSLGLTLRSESSGESHYTLGVLPVIASDSAGNAFKGNFQNLLISAFDKKERFTLVERTRLEAVTNEKRIQEDADFLNGSVVAQGKSVGAQFLVSGNITQLVYKEEEIKLNSSTFGKLSNISSNVAKKIRATVTASVQVIDVETGKVKSHKSFMNTNTYVNTNLEKDVINTINGMRDAVSKWLANEFPVLISVLQIEKSDKNGIPETLLISGGAEIDLKEGAKLEVYVNEVINSGGKELKRVVQLGTVKVEKIEGEVSTVKIKEGAELIGQKLNEKKVLLLKYANK